MSGRYPTDDELRQLREWPATDPRGWLEFAQGIWEYEEWGWQELEGEVSTGGWSGNEDIIDAMQENWILWSLTWQVHRRGGHYQFALPRVTQGQGT